MPDQSSSARSSQANRIASAEEQGRRFCSWPPTRLPTDQDRQGSHLAEFDAVLSVRRRYPERVAKVMVELRVPMPANRWQSQDDLSPSSPRPGGTRPHWRSRWLPVVAPAASRLRRLPGQEVRGPRSGAQCGSSHPITAKEKAGGCRPLANKIRGRTCRRGVAGSTCGPTVADGP